jgi:hypothetical protein
MKFATILGVLLIAQCSCASPIEISPLPPPTTAVGNQSRTKLKHRTRPFFYGAIHTAVPNIIALNQQLPVGVKNASVRKQNVPISPVERNVYTVEGDLWRVTMEPNDDEYHLEISARGAARTSKRIIVEIPPGPYLMPARAANCCHFLREITFLSRRRFKISSRTRFQFA